MALELDRFISRLDIVKVEGSTLTNTIIEENQRWLIDLVERVGISNHGRSLHMVRFRYFCEQIYRDPNEILQIFRRIYGVNFGLTAKGVIISKTAVRMDLFVPRLLKFLNQNILCPRCGSKETRMDPNRDITCIGCSNVFKEQL